MPLAKVVAKDFFTFPVDKTKLCVPPMRDNQLRKPAVGNKILVTL